MRSALSLAAVLLLAACATAPVKPPTGATVAEPAETVEAEAHWRELPLAKGSWLYRPDSAGSAAMFGEAGQESALILRCQLPARMLQLSRPGAVPMTLTVMTSTGSASYAAKAVPGNAPRIGFALAGAEPMLDRIVFSSGRFAIAAEGQPTLVVPAWAEPIRVVEDCRG